jgi:3-deoxy-D-arabino-heptulosonate 7-phosphate (DAHP) synthase class II
VQVSDKMDPSQLVALIATLNPENTPGRLAVIVRMGAPKLREKLPALLEAVASAGQVVAWVCDPMHGNTEEVQGFKTRRYDNIRAEVEAFFDVHDECGTVPGGIHLEMTGERSQPASQPARGWRGGACVVAWAGPVGFAGIIEGWWRLGGPAACAIPFTAQSNVLLDIALC